MSASSTSRRGILAGVVATLAVPAIALADTRSAGNGAAVHPDAELIGWCAALIAMEAQHVQELRDNEDVERPAGYDATIRAVEDTPAKTDDGNRAKLAAAVAFYDPDPQEEGSLYGNVLWGAVCALAKPPDGPAIVAADPDAELLDACEEFHAWHEAAYSCPTDDDALLNENLFNRGEWSDFIQEIKPVTSAGRTAKIKVALALMEENRSKEPNADWEFAFATLTDLAEGVA